jgi:cytochrome P450 family 97 subfamily B polypeptide 3
MVTLDIIGKAVFNYDFGSVTNGSPIVKAVYRVLREAEHRSSSFIPYWNLPYADQWMGGQVEFRQDMTMLDDILADLINDAVATRSEADIEELEKREYLEDPSLLRFLVDMRGEDLSSRALRDDLMTMLIGMCITMCLCSTYFNMWLSHIALSTRWYAFVAYKNCIAYQPDTRQRLQC